MNFQPSGARKPVGHMLEPIYEACRVSIQATGQELHGRFCRHRYAFALGVTVLQQDKEYSRLSRLRSYASFLGAKLLCLLVVIP